MFLQNAQIGSSPSSTFTRRSQRAFEFREPREPERQKDNHHTAKRCRQRKPRHVVRGELFGMTRNNRRNTGTAIARPTAGHMPEYHAARMTGNTYPTGKFVGLGGEVIDPRASPRRARPTRAVECGRTGAATRDESSSLLRQYLMRDGRLLLSLLTVGLAECFGRTTVNFL